MQWTDTIIVGAGQAGLAMSHSLNSRGVDHVVLERGRVAERWRSERWDSLRLLTPNWMTRLPGWSYRGGEPDGFMAAADFVRYLEGYAGASHAPIQADTEVLSVRRGGASGFRVDTSRGAWDAGAVVVATGHCDVPAVPAMARSACRPPSTSSPRPTTGTPPCFPAGGVLVVGASATGVQLADEIRARAGRSPFRWAGTRGCRGATAGRDIWWWLETDRRARRDRGRCRRTCGARGTNLLPARRPPRRRHPRPRDAARRGRAPARPRRSAPTAPCCASATTWPKRPRPRSGRSNACWRASTPPPMPTALRGSRARPAPSTPARRPRARPRSRGHTDGDLGHGLRAELRLAQGARPRCGGRDRPRGRRHTLARALRPRPALPAPPALELHRRRRPRRRGAGRGGPRTTWRNPAASRPSDQERSMFGRTNTTPWWSARAAPAPPRRCSWPGAGSGCSRSTAATTARTPCPRTR